MAQIHFETLGCKLNQIESESVARKFIDANFSVQMENSTAEGKIDYDTILCIINTCTVTSKAEQKARRIFRLVLQKFPHGILIITGCYAQLDGAFIESMDRRIIVLPGQQKDLLFFLPNFLKENCKVLEPSKYEDRRELLQTFFEAEKKAFFEKNKTDFLLSTDTFLQHSRASIKIQDGCNNHCTYCRIRLARGKSLSLSPATILERIKKLEENNQQEVVITGVNLSQYAQHFEDGSSCDLAALLDFILKNTKNIALRISSLYPQRVDTALCKVLDNPRVQPHFHLSIQSGSEKILSSMNRPYQKEQVLNAVSQIRAIKPDAFLACDIIVGFPGETEEDFQDTLDVVEACKYDSAFTFIFSPREGTPAARMEDDVTLEVKNERLQRLNERVNFYSKQANDAYLGKVVPVLIEGYSEKDPNILMGYTDTMKLVNIVGDSNYIGKVVDVEITDVKTWSMDGKIV